MIRLFTGRAVKKISHLKPLLTELIISAVSRNGSYLGGLTNAADIFLWHKDTDKVYWTESIPGITTPLSNKVPVCLFLSPDAQKVLVVIGFCKIYVWQKNLNRTPENINKRAVLFGCWSFIDTCQPAILPKIEHQETSIYSSFLYDNYFINDCIITFVFSSDNNICISTCFIKKVISFFCSESKSKCNCLHADWTYTSIPFQSLHQFCEPIKRKGSLVSRHSFDGRILALAINQVNTHSAQLLFFSLFTQSTVCVNLQGCGASHPVKSFTKDYWICDMVWTADDAFVVCCTRQGSVCVISRLGSLMTLTITGDSINLGPSFYLPLIPLAVVSRHTNTETNEDDSLSTITDQSLKQKFSLTSHRHFPLFIISDGYLLMCIQFPDCCVGISNIIRSLLYHSYQLVNPVFQIYDSKMLNYQHILSVKPNDASGNSLNGNSFECFNNQNSNTSFRDTSTLSVHPVEVLNSTAVDWEEKQIIEGMNSILSIWNLCASSSCFWTNDLELLTSHAIDGLLRIVQYVITHSLGINKMSDLKTPCETTTTLGFLESIIQKFFHSLNFDFIQFNLLSSSLKLSHELTQLFCRNQESVVPYVDSICTAMKLLNNSEKIMKEVYSFSRQLHTSWHYVKRECFMSSYVPHKFIHNNTDNQDNQEISNEVYINERLLRTWKFLYQKVIDYYKIVVDSKVTTDVENKAVSLLCTVQRMMQIHGFSLNEKIFRRKVSIALIIYLNGKHDKAIKLWKKKIYSNNELNGYCARSKKVSHYMHRILYSFLLDKNMVQALNFICELIWRNRLYQSYSNGINQKENVSGWFLNQEDIIGCCSIAMKSITICKVIRSFSRILAAYFVNKSIYLPSISSGKSFSSLLENKTMKGCSYHRIDQNDITKQIMEQKISHILSPNATLELLLIVGLWSEAVWFLLQLGDWKVAFLLAYLHKYLPERYRKWHPLSDNLSPESILLENLKVLLNIKNIEASRQREGIPNRNILLETSQEKNKVKCIHSMLLPAVVCNLNVLPHILRNLLDELKVALRDLKLLTDSSVYLPAPPLYCPQEIHDIKGQESSTELKLRCTITNIVQDIVFLLRASNTALPVIYQYLNFCRKIRHLLDISEKPFIQLHTIVEALRMEDSVQYSLENFENDRCAKIIVNCFQSVCAILWMLHLRDNISLIFRKLQDGLFIPGKTRSETEFNYTCKEVLMWGKHLYPFQSFFQPDDCLDHFIINLALESKPSEELIEYIASIFYDYENLNTNLKKQLTDLLENWKTIKTEYVQTDLVTQEEDNFPNSDTHELNRINMDEQEVSDKENLNENLHNPEGDSNKISESSLRMVSFYDLFLHKCSKHKQKLNHTEKLISMFKNKFAFSSLENNENLQCYLYPFELEELYFQYLEMFFDVNIFKHIEKDLSEQLNMPLIDTNIKNVRQSLFFSTRNFYSRKDQPIFPMMQSWIFHFLSKKKYSKQRKINGSKLRIKRTRYKKLAKTHTAHEIQNKVQLKNDNSNKNLKGETSNKTNRQDKTNWKPTSFDYSTQENALKQYSGFDCLDLGPEKTVDEINWLFHWAENISLPSHENELHKKPQIKFEIYPMQILFALQNIKSNFKTNETIVDNKNDKNNVDKESDEHPTKNIVNETEDNMTLIQNDTSRTEQKINEDSITNEREKENSDTQNDHTCNDSLGTDHHPLKESIMQHKNPVIYNSLKQSILSLKQQLNRWKEKRVATSNIIHSSLNKLEKNEQNVKEIRKVDMYNGENISFVQSSRSSHSDSLLHQRNINSNSNSRVSQYLSLPTISMKENEAVSDNNSSLTAVTKVAYSEEQSSPSCNSKSKISTVTFSDEQDPFHNSSQKTLSKVVSNKSQDTDVTSTLLGVKHKNKETIKNTAIQTEANESERVLDASRQRSLPMKEVLVSSAQETFRHELRTMAEQMGLSFLAGAIGCMTAQSHIISRCHNPVNVNTQTDIDERASEPNDNNLHLEQQRKETMLRKKKSRTKEAWKEKKKIMENKNLLINNKQEVYVPVYVSDALKSPKNKKLATKVNIDESNTGEEMYTGKDVTPDTLKELSEMENSDNELFDSLSDSHSNLADKEENLNPSVMFSNDWIQDKNFLELLYAKKYISRNIPKKHLKNLLPFQLLSMPAQKSDALPLEKQYRIINQWKIEMESKRKHPDITTMLPNVLKSERIKKGVPLLQCNKNYQGPLLYVEEKESICSLHRNILDAKQNHYKDIPTRYVQEYLSKKQKTTMLDMKVQKKKQQDLENSSEEMKRTDRRNEKEDSVRRNFDKEKEEVKKLSDQIISRQMAYIPYFSSEKVDKGITVDVPHSYADIQYNIVKELNNTLKKVDSTTQTIQFKVKHADTITDEAYCTGNDTVVTQAATIQKMPNISEEAKEIFENVQLKIPPVIQQEECNDDFNTKNLPKEELRINEQLSNTRKEDKEIFDNVQMKVPMIQEEHSGDLNIKNLCKEKFQTNEKFPNKSEEDKEIFDNMQLKISVKQQEEYSDDFNIKNLSKDEFKTNENFSDILPLINYLLTPEETVVENLKNNINTKRICSVQGEQITEKDSTEIIGDNKLEDQKYDEKLLNAENDAVKENMFETGDRLTCELLSGKTNYRSNYVTGTDSKLNEETGNRNFAKSSLNQQLIEMQEKLDKIEEVSNTVQEELKIAKEALFTFDDTQLFDRVTTASDVEKFQSYLQSKVESKISKSTFAANNFAPYAETADDTSIPNSSTAVNKCQLTEEPIRDVIAEDEINPQILNGNSAVTATKLENLQRKQKLDNFEKRKRNAISLLKEMTSAKNHLEAERSSQYSLLSKNHQTNRKFHLDKSILKKRKIFQNAVSTEAITSQQYQDSISKNLKGTFRHSSAKNKVINETSKKKITLLTKDCRPNKLLNIPRSNYVETNFQQNGRPALGETFIVNKRPAECSKSKTEEELESIQQKVLLSLKRLYGPSNLRTNIKVPATYIDKSGSSDSLSPWSVPEDVKRILYGSEDNSLEDLGIGSKEKVGRRSNESIIDTDISLSEINNSDSEINYKC